MQPYRTLMDHVCVLAQSPAETITFLTAILADPEMTHRSAYPPTLNNQDRRDYFVKNPSDT